MIAARWLVILAALVPPVDAAEAVAADADARRQAELAEHVRRIERESGWFTIRHPDPAAAARTEPVERLREDLSRVLIATQHLLPARKPVLLATLADPGLPAPIRFALASYLGRYHLEVGLDREERLRVDGVLYGQLDYDYSRAISHLTRVVLRDFRGQPAPAVIAALRAAAWPATDDDIAYAVETVAPTVRLP